MGQLLHGCARRVQAVRRAIQCSSDSAATLAERYHINPKTVRKWKKRSSTHDAPMGPKRPRSTVLSREEEALIVAFRKHTLLSLDDCLYALQPTIPHLTRSTLHRCLQRRGISRLPDTREKPKKKAFKKHPIGYFHIDIFHIDIAEVQTEEGKLYLFVAIDRTSKFAYAELQEKHTRRIAAGFLRHLIEAVPYRLHTVLTDNGIQFTHRKTDHRAFEHLFDRVCREHGIEHRLTRPNHPWTNGQVERMNRTLKDATVKRYHYEAHEQLKQHLCTFLMAYNHAKRLKTLRGLTPYEYICQQWQRVPERFHRNPLHHTVGLNTFKHSAVIWGKFGDEVFTHVIGDSAVHTAQRSLLISDEGISAGGRRPFFLRAHLEEFQEKAFEWGFASLKLICVFRRQDQWLGSHYAQISDRIPNASQQDFESFVDDMLDETKYYYPRSVLLDYKILRSQLVQAVGRENVLMLPYELLENDLTTYLSRMLEFLGARDDEIASQLSPELKATSDEARKNVRSLSKDTWAIRDRTLEDAYVLRLRPGRLFKALGLPTVVPLWWPEFGREESIQLTKALREKVLDTFAKSNRNLAADLGMDLKQYGYYTDPPAPHPEQIADAAALPRRSDSD